MPLSPVQAYEILYEFLQREKRNRERFLKEPRRSKAIEEAEQAQAALQTLTKFADLQQYTQLQLQKDEVRFPRIG
jgi:hypothetical protein